MNWLSRSAMTFIMLAIFVTMVWIASGYPANARFMPFVVGIPAIGLCLLQLVLDARSRRPVAAADTRGTFEKAEQTVSEMVGRQVNFEVAREPMPVVEIEPELSPRETVRRELTLWGWFVGFIAGILLFGFWVTIPIFLIFFLRLQARSSWGLALGLGLGVTVLLFLAFSIAFRIEVHPGFITGYVQDYFQG
ncbi:MAG TPA: hypothetical protein VHN20_04495 [Beijerinckiaceae bacterium]|nr:hypothetical protein [Beijerinckiaceae bacterium]